MRLRPKKDRGYPKRSIGDSEISFYFYDENGRSQITYDEILKKNLSALIGYEIYYAADGVVHKETVTQEWVDEAVLQYAGLGIN